MAHNGDYYSKCIPILQFLLFHCFSFFLVRKHNLLTFASQPVRTKISPSPKLHHLQIVNYGIRLHVMSFEITLAILHHSFSLDNFWNLHSVKFLLHSLYPYIIFLLYPFVYTAYWFFGLGFFFLLLEMVSGVQLSEGFVRLKKCWDFKAETQQDVSQ